MDRVKVLFVQKIEENEFETESLWCIKMGDGYVVDNIPFIAERVALGDTINIEYDKDDDVYYFDDFLVVSGNSTVRLYFENKELIEPTRVELNILGCESEVFLQRQIVAMSVPKEVNYWLVKEYLEEGEKQHKWQYENLVCHTDTRTLCFPHA